MKSVFHAVALSLGAVMFATALAPHLVAQCSGVGTAKAAPAAWRGLATAPRLLRAGFAANGDHDRDDVSIVGFWHVKFIAEGNKGGPPDGTEIDAGYQQWHSDNTEFLNSGSRSPIIGNFCQGVWKEVEEHHYKLNHFAINWDPTGKVLIGPIQIREDVYLAPGGKRFDGTFSIAAFDEGGNALAGGSVKGIIVGARITVETPATPIF